jgi:hypothetical protein
LNLKKSTFQLKKEAEELKKSQEALEAARVLEEYEQSFGDKHQDRFSSVSMSGPSWVRSTPHIQTQQHPQSEIQKQSFYKPQPKITMKLGSSSTIRVSSC